jgi:hypothetical protein
LRSWSRQAAVSDEVFDTLAETVQLEVQPSKLFGQLAKLVVDCPVRHQRATPYLSRLITALQLARVVDLERDLAVAHSPEAMTGDTRRGAGDTHGHEA